jgi:Glycosyl hydrolases family 16
MMAHRPIPMYRVWGSAAMLNTVMWSTTPTGVPDMGAYRGVDPVAHTLRGAWRAMTTPQLTARDTRRRRRRRRRQIRLRMRLSAALGLAGVLVTGAAVQGVGVPYPGSHVTGSASTGDVIDPEDNQDAYVNYYRRNASMRAEMFAALAAQRSAAAAEAEAAAAAQAQADADAAAAAAAAGDSGDAQSDDQGLDPAPEPIVAPSRVTNPAGMVLVFSDDFDGSSLNTGIWAVYNNTYGDGNHELACLTPNNVTVSGGLLQITAKRETVTCPNGSVRKFTSGFVTTRDTKTYFPRYGRYEIRGKLPHGQGLWPAFWLRHRDGASTAEVDIMEYFHSQVPGESTQTLHLDGVSNVTKKTSEFEANEASPGWHTWAVDIKPAANGAVTFSFLTDGVVDLTYTDTRANWAKLYSGQPLFDIAINMAVGGDWAGNPDDPLGWLSNLNRCAQGGTGPNNCKADGIQRAVFPSTFLVDYVRVWQAS